MKIKNLILSRVIVDVEDLIEERLYEGPIIGFQIQIKNNTDTTLTLYPSESDFYIRFTRNGSKYTKEVIGIPLITFPRQGIFSSLNVLFLKPNDEITVSFGRYIFLGTTILQPDGLKHYDYTKEMIKVLPTIKVLYRDKSNKMESCGIENVTLGEDYHYIPKI
jgi:hypothetical protein